jgi:hypothetical protein
MARSVENTERDALEFQDDDLELVRTQFEEYADATIESRASAEKCRRYRDGEQWTSDERATLKKRKQPCITDNKIQDKCDTLLGIEKQMRTDPKAFPRNPGDEGGAEAATDALRFISDQSNFNRSVRKPAADNLMVEGLCAGQVIVEKRKGREPKVCMEHIRWDRVYYDVHALKDDFSDKTYCGYFRWMDYETAKQDWPNREAAMEQSFGNESVHGSDESLDDKPRYIMFQSKRKRLQVFKHYVLKRGVWHEGVWCRGGWLEDLKPCKYQNEDGEPDCCMELQALYRDHDGNPYGSVPRYLDLQDEHNKRRSKMLHLLNAKRMVVIKGTFEDVNQARAELHKPDGVIEVPTDDVNKGLRVDDNIAEAQGQWQLLQQTDLALSQTGPNAALQGQSGTISGRAKQLDQQSGSLPISPLFDALDSWETRMYRQAWNRVKQYWTTEVWIRVTDDENKVRFVGLNQPVLAGDVLAEQLKAEQIPPEQKAEMVQQLASDPAMQTPALGPDGQPQLKNNVAAMDVDIIIDRTADTVNIQQEQFEMLASLAETRPEVPFKTLVEMSQLRSDVKKRVLDQLTGENDPAAQQRAQFQQMMEQMQAMLMEAQVRRENAAAAKDEAATVESHIDAAVKTATFTNGNEQAGQPGAKPASKSQVSVN